MPKTKYLKNYIHPKLVRLNQVATYTESGEIDDYYPFFSTAPCDCCNTAIAGDRYECDPVLDTQQHPLTIPVVFACVDCVIKFQ
jgi:hypothetical protein